MAEDDYPFPVHDLLPIPATLQEARAFEGSVVALLNECIADLHGGALNGLRGDRLSVDVVGEPPESRFVMRYRSHSDGEYETTWGPLWVGGEPEVGDGPRRGQWSESPASLGSLLVMYWGAGEIPINADDPFSRR